MLDLGPLPKVNPRHFAVTDAKLQLEALLLNLRKSHNLTVSEEFYIISTVLQTLAVQCVNSERETD